MLIYDDVDEEVLRSFYEISLANLIFYAMKEGACSEQSSRMTAMEAASKNAGKVVLFNVSIVINPQHTVVVSSDCLSTCHALILEISDN